MIVYPSQDIKKSIVQIKYEGGNGTGFFVSESLLVTAYHVLKNFKELKDNKIDLQFFSEPVCNEGLTFDFIIKNKIYDLAIIEIKGDLPYPIKPIKIKVKTNFIKGKAYGIWGYPKNDNAMREFNLKFNDINPSLENNILTPILQFNANQILETYEGISGAPIIYNDYAIGWIIEDFEEENANVLDARSFADELVIAELYRKKKTKDLLSIKSSYVHEWVIPPFSKEYFSTYMIHPFIDFDNSNDAEKIFLGTIEYFIKQDSHSNFNILIFPELFLTVSKFFAILETMGTLFLKSPMPFGITHLGLKNDSRSDFNYGQLRNLYTKLIENKNKLKISNNDLLIFKTFLNKIKEVKKRSKAYRVNILFYFDQNSTFRFCLQISCLDSSPNPIFIQSIQLCDYISVVDILPMTSNDILNSENQIIFDQEINYRIRTEKQKIEIISTLSNILSKMDTEKWDKYKEKFHKLSNGQIVNNFDGVFLLSANSENSIQSNTLITNLNPNISGCLTVNEIEESMREYEKQFNYFKDIEFYNKDSSVWENNQESKGRVSVKCIYHSDPRAFGESIMIGFSIDMLTTVKTKKMKEIIKLKFKNYSSWETFYD